MRRMLFTLFAVMGVAVFVSGCELASDVRGKEVMEVAKNFGAEIAKEDYKAARAFLLKEFIWFDSDEKQHGSVEGKSGKTSFLKMLHEAKNGGTFLMTVDRTNKISDTRYVVITTNTVASGSWQIRLSFVNNGTEWELVEAKELTARPNAATNEEFDDEPSTGHSSDLAKQPRVGGGDMSYQVEEAQYGNGGSPATFKAKKNIAETINKLPGSAGANR